MKWKHYTVLHKSSVSGTCDQKSIDLEIEIGRLHSGKSRVYMGAYCCIKYGDQQVCSEEDTLLKSLNKAAEHLDGFGIKLTIYGLQKDFYESGLSFDTGWGYVPDKLDPVLMISVIEDD